MVVGEPTCVTKSVDATPTWQPHRHRGEGGLQACNQDEAAVPHGDPFSTLQGKSTKVFVARDGHTQSPLNKRESFKNNK